MREINLEAWKRQNPRSSKWYPNLFVDFNPNGSKDPTRYSWTYTRYLILQRDGYKCRVCGSNGNDCEVKKKVHGQTWVIKGGIEIQHIIPKSQGGTDHPANLITLCRKCHLKTFKKHYAGVPATPMGDQAQLTSFSGVMCGE